MQCTAVGLLDSSKQASQRAESAVKASIEASSNVSTAATELSASIAEIGHQLTRATEVVRVTVTEAETTNQQIAGLADAAQKIGDVVKLIRDIAGQPISWRSTPPSRRRALARPGAVLRRWPPT
jgi:methyl-accepting chemotaxis protein